MSKTDANERAAARKILAKQLRRKAYLAAKERHAKDPKVIAMKEAMKQRRREVYQEAKARMKEQRQGVAKAEKVQRAQQHAEKRAASDEALRTLIKKGKANVSAEPSTAEHHAGESEAHGEAPLLPTKKSAADSYGPN